MILVIAEQRDGKLNRATWEAIAAAQQPPADADHRRGARARASTRVGGRARGRRRRRGHRRRRTPALEQYTADGYVAALQALIEQLSPSLVLLPHTYQTRDFAPALAARLDRALVTDVHRRSRRDGGTAAFVAADVPGQADRRRRRRRDRRRIS